MIYKKLSIAAGGGIIDQINQVDQDDCANIIIGLGGTGIECLKKIKQEVYNRIKPDDATSIIPTYQHIQFLAIDSDRCSINEETFAGIDPVNEFFDIGCNDIHAILGFPKLLHQTPSLRWLCDRITILNVGAGAGGVRQIGRLLMMLKVSTVASKIQDSISKAINGLNFAPINIHILTGMGGGTGSGIFLDVCYIIRHIINQLGLAGRANTYGYFFLPDVNMERVHADAVRQYITINGFAAMKELDHCMNFQQNGGEWNQTYDSFTVNTKESPVNVAFLVSARDENGTIRENGYNNALNVVADYILNTMIRQGLPVWMHFVPNQQQRRGACYRYCILGASHAYIPFKDINSYLAARIFETYQELPVTNYDIDAFISDNGLTYRNLLNSISKGVKNIPIFEVDTRTLIEQVVGITPDTIPHLLSQMIDVLPQIEGELSSNRENQVQSVILGIKEKLIEITKTPGKGPFYASLFLRNSDRNTKDFMNVLDGYIKENDEKLSNARISLALYESSIATTLRELQNARLVRNTKAKNYVSAVHSYYTQLARIALFKEMDYFLKQLKYQVVELYESFFFPINAIFANITETFNDNYYILTKRIDFDVAYADKIIGLGDENFKASLDAIVESIDSKKIVNRFISYMIDRSDEWLTYNSDHKICTAVSHFFIQQLSGFTHKNIDDYLRVKYQAVNQQQLSLRIYQDVLIRLKEKARPLFWTNITNEPLDNNLRTGFCLFPNNTATITAAAIMLNQADNQISFRSTTALDRISMFILYSGIPMYMYRGSVVNKAFYEQHNTPGLHIYEGTKHNHRDFRKLHSIIPLSLYSDDELEAVENFVCDYKRAVENGIIIKQVNDYQLRFVDDEDFTAKKRRIDAIIKKCSNASGEDYKKCIDEADDFIKDEHNTHIMFKNCIILPNTGVAGYKDSVVRDHVFASEYYTSMLNEQLAKIDELESLRLRLKSILKYMAT